MYLALGDPHKQLCHHVLSDKLFIHTRFCLQPRSQLLKRWR